MSSEAHLDTLVSTDAKPDRFGPFVVEDVDAEASAKVIEGEAASDPQEAYHTPAISAVAKPARVGPFVVQDVDAEASPNNTEGEAASANELVDIMGRVAQVAASRAAAETVAQLSKPLQEKLSVKPRSSETLIFECEMAGANVEVSANLGSDRTLRLALLLRDSGALFAETFSEAGQAVRCQLRIVFRELSERRFDIDLVSAKPNLILTILDGAVALELPRAVLHDFRALEERVAALSERVAELEAANETLVTRLGDLETARAELRMRVSDIESLREVVVPRVGALEAARSLVSPRVRALEESAQALVQRVGGAEAAQASLTLTLPPAIHAAAVLSAEAASHEQRLASLEAARVTTHDQRLGLLEAAQRRSQDQNRVISLTTGATFLLGAGADCAVAWESYLVEPSDAQFFARSEDCTGVTVRQGGLYRIDIKLLSNRSVLRPYLEIGGKPALWFYGTVLGQWHDATLNVVLRIIEGSQLRVKFHEELTPVGIYSKAGCVHYFCIQKL